MLAILWSWWYGVKPKEPRRIIFLPTQQERFQLPPGRHTLTPERILEWYFKGERERASSLASLNADPSTNV